MGTKFVALLLFCIFIINAGYAQVTDAEKALRTQVPDSMLGWKKTGMFGLNFSQSSFTNWASGGQNSLAINSLFNITVCYRNQKSAWDNFLALGYGMQQQGKSGKPIKTDDKVEFTSKYGRTAYKNLFYAALLNFKTQMAPGYNYPNDSVRISDFMAPAYLTIALGMDFKKNDNLSVFAAPLTGRITFVNSQTLADAGAYGVDPAVYDTLGKMISSGKKSKQEFGGYIRLYYKAEVMKNVMFQSKVDLFSNYLKHPENVDVNWEALISMKVNKYISATLSTNLIYDDDVIITQDKNSDGVFEVNGPRIQFKEILAVGFSYKF
jgi:hypothetical protein